MRNPFPLLLILALLSTLASSLHYDYELSRGRKMWLGAQRAVHYFDHFKLLTHRMSNIKGLITSYYPFIYKDEWSLAFELLKMGPTASEKDGFMLHLSPQNFDAFEVAETSKSKQSFLETAVS